MAVGAKGFDNGELQYWKIKSTGTPNGCGLYYAWAKIAYVESPGNIRDLHCRRTAAAGRRHLQPEKSNFCFTWKRPLCLPVSNCNAKPFYCLSGRVKQPMLLRIFYSAIIIQMASCHSARKSMGEMVLYDHRYTETKREIFNADVLWMVTIRSLLFWIRTQLHQLFVYTTWTAMRWRNDKAHRNSYC